MQDSEIQEIKNKVSVEMAQGIKKILEDDFVTHTIPFSLVKINLIRSVFNKYHIGGNKGIVFDKVFLQKGWRSMIIVWFLYKTRLFRTYRSVWLLDRFMKIPQMIRPRWYLKMDGHKLVMKYHDKSMKEIFNDYIAIKNSVGLWEPETTKLVKEYVKEGDVCVDIGASIGYFTLLLARQVGKRGRVLAFEPTPNQIPYITENIRKNGYKDIAKIYNVGAWDKTDKVLLPVNAAVKYNSVCVAVDDVLEQEGIKNVDFIKIDVDGPDTKVLKGLIRTIERSPNLKMVCEYYPQYIKDAGDDPEEFMSIIKKYFNYEEVPDDYSDGCWNLFCIRK